MSSYEADLEREFKRRLSLKTISFIELKKKGFKTIIPELRVGNKVAYGIAVEGDKAYVVFPNGLEEEIKRVFKVKEVIVITPKLGERPESGMRR